MYPKFEKLEDLHYLEKSKVIGSGAFSQVKLIQHVNDSSQSFAIKQLFKKDEVEEFYIKKEIELH